MYSGLTRAGKSFINSVCSGTGRSLLDGKSNAKITDTGSKYYNPDGHLPFCMPVISASKIWYSQAKYNGKTIQNDQELGIALIDWYDKYGKIFQMDANIIAAQGWAESGYKIWNYPLTSTASGIGQFTVEAVFDVIATNKFATQPEYRFTAQEIAAITKNWSGNTSDIKSFKVGYPLGKRNRPYLHQNICDNPEIMIKAHYAYMKYLSGRCDGIASSSLFGYNRGPAYAFPSYTRSISSATNSDNYEKEGIDYVFKIFQLLGNKNYNKTITKSMLSWSEVKNEIMRYQDIIKERADFCKAPTIAFALPQNNLIGSLRNFNSIDAVRFYRNTISDTYSKLLRYREEEFLTESLKEFLDLDIYLSPFTSYPINNPIQLLFTRPFERLYNNAYLIDESDYERFIQRAYIVYSHFGQILGKGMRYLLWERDSHVEIVINNLDKPKEVIDQEYLEQLDFPTRNYIPDEMNFGGTLDTILKTSIFYWNIASYRMDTLCKMLINYTKDFNGSRKFRIFSDDAGLNVIDLETDKRIIDSKESSELNGTYFLIDVMLENSKDPFIDFRPCDVFKEVGLKAEIKGYGDLYEALDRNFDYGIGYE